MKNSLLKISLFALATISISACTKVIDGKGPSVSENRMLSNFSSINSEMSGNVYIRQDSFYKVEVRGQQNVLNALQTTVSGGELNISFKNSTLLIDNETVEVYISCPNVVSIRQEGSGNISATNKLSSSNMKIELNSSGTISLSALNSNTLDASISGSGKIDVLSGWASTLALNTSGSGKMNLSGLESDYARVKISGSGSSRVFVQKQLDANISGSGDIYYLGNPFVNSNISGSGRVRKM